MFTGFTIDMPATTKTSAILLLACLLQAVPAHAEWFADVTAELISNDNLGRSGKDPADDTGLSAGAALGHYRQTGLYTGLAVIGSVRKNLWNTYSGLNSLDLGLDAELSHKFGIGDDVPRLRARLGYHRETFNWDARDADAFTAGIDIGRRFTERLLLSAGLSYEKVDGDNSAAIPPAGLSWGVKAGDVWDYSAWSLMLGGELDLGPASWLSGVFRYRDGDIVSTGIVYTGNPGALACTHDPVFGPKAAVYRLDAKTRSVSIDYNRAVFSRATWYAGFEYQHSAAGTGTDYDVRLLRTGFIHSF